MGMCGSSQKLSTVVIFFFSLQRDSSSSTAHLLRKGQKSTVYPGIYGLRPSRLAFADLDMDSVCMHSVAMITGIRFFFSLLPFDTIAFFPLLLGQWVVVCLLLVGPPITASEVRWSISSLCYFTSFESCSSGMPPFFILA